MKILIVTQHILPMQTPRAHRSTELIKEFVRMGHEVTVYAVLGKYDYTSFLEEYPCSLKTIPINFQWHPYSSDADGRRYLIDKVLNKLLSQKFHFPDIEFYFKLPGLLAKEPKHDYIISIGAPHPIHWGVAKFKKDYRAKFPDVWTADCGDPFMFNGNVPKSKKKFEKFERMFCESCNHITVPIESAKNAYYPEYIQKIKVVPQGFDFNLKSVKDKEFTPINKIPHFGFAGTFINDIRNPSKILDYLASSKTDFIFEVFTAYTDLLEPYIKKLGKKIVVHKPIAREKLLSKLREMDFLLNIENLNSPGQLPSKLIDYAICERPILSLNPQAPDIDKIEMFLSGNYQKRLEIKNLESYHISNIAKKFIELCSISET